MVGEDTHFRERAPCGWFVRCIRHREDDAAGLLVDDVAYECGCRQVWHEFHDGSVRIRTVRHDGKVLVDEHSADHEA
ncbi:hypothetical protein [Saccharopolyspora elongata]|uniref:Uncharacterized protein n=1 Tax=Saccharopolyspora elongata TaxID=2530387 RepID=A0A4R4YSC0_9PSEU|nr:hypothetical protein [Saccharopolyspora elongata]TDD48126.1 hypothetical protein E1288_22765 [Saccharopolyspora elongata]